MDQTDVGDLIVIKIEDCEAPTDSIKLEIINLEPRLPSQIFLVTEAGATKDSKSNIALDDQECEGSDSLDQNQERAFAIKVESPTCSEIELENANSNLDEDPLAIDGGVQKQLEISPDLTEVTVKVEDETEHFENILNDTNSYLVDEVKCEDEVDIADEGVQPEVSEPTAGDMENFMEYHLMGSVSQICMKLECIPSNLHDNTIDLENQLLSYVVGEDVTVAVAPMGTSPAASPSKILLSLPDNNFKLPNSDTTNDENVKAGDESFQNAFCKEVFSIKLRKGKQFECKICNKLLCKYSSLVNHLKIHTGQKPYQCEVCLKVFAQNAGLWTHKQKCQNNVKPYLCSFCSKTFTEKKTIIIHERIHTGEKPFQCDVCSKQFYSKMVMVLHKRIHSGDRPYICDFCPKAFTNSSILANHKRIHERDRQRQFVCEICSKGFFRKVDLRDHQKSHTGEKPFQCEICLNYFTHKANLNKHMKTHEKKERLSCRFCEDSFTSKTLLTKHEKLHTGEKPYQCSKVCIRKFDLLIKK